jgi:hypothetical protein
MEFCGVFYETGYLRAVYDRIRKLFFVFLMAAAMLLCVQTLVLIMTTPWNA